jgi:hypothetical protein
LTKSLSEQQKTAIQSYVKKGYSSTRIQKSLSERHMGLRRKVLLAEIRRVKGQAPKAETVKYIPKKYRQARWLARAELESILAWLCLFTKDNGLITWFLLQLIKGTYTLRIGFKGKKKPPKIVYRYPKDGRNQDKQIAKFLENRKFILEFLDSTKRN